MRKYFETMSLFDRVAHTILLALFNHRDIDKDGSLYLRRFFLTPRRFRWRLFLHNIRRPDDDRWPHDHPWPFKTIVLKGGYEEIYWTGETVNIPAVRKYVGGSGDFAVTRVRRLLPGGRASNKAEHTHRITALLCKPGASTWTLLLVGRAYRVWGFRTPKEWIDWRTYLGLPANTPDSPEDVDS